MSTPSNYVTAATATLGNKYLFVDSTGEASSTHVRLSDGTSLGLVQSVKWTLHLGDLARCEIETIATPGELKALMQNTTVRVLPWGSPIKWLWTYFVGKLTGRATRFVSLFRS